MRKLCLMLVVLMSVSTIFAGTASQQLQQKLDKYHTLTANFSQKVTSASGQLLQQSQGEVAIKRPNYFLWQTAKPLSQLIIANHDKLTIYDKDLQQVTVKRLGTSVSQTPLLLLSSAKINLAQQFKIKLDKKTNSYILTPAHSDEDFKMVELRFDSHDRIQQMELATNLGQITDIYFSHVKIGAVLPNSRFDFTLPIGVNVVSQYK